MARLSSPRVGGATPRSLGVVSALPVRRTKDALLRSWADQAHPIFLRLLLAWPDVHRGAVT